jgi:NAD(P)-dependent dehydrogenase (short-subunit alcohol dehydrogenase family)
MNKLVLACLVLAATIVYRSPPINRIMAGLVRVIRQKYNPPKPSTASFEGKTILITAATGGLGLEAAKKLAAQGTSTLFITARDEAKGAAAKSAIEAHARGSKTKIIPLILEMSDPSSIHAFLSSLQQHTKHLDHAILNAGVVERTYSASASGWERAIQINAISTILLSLLLLPLLAASPLSRQSDLHLRPHLVYISSGTAWFVKPEQITKFTKSDHPLKDFSTESNFPPGAMGGQTQYARSKYILEHCFRRVAALPFVKSSGVLVVSTCPGICKSDLGRQFTDSLVMRVGAVVFMALAARETADGANTYITALEQGGEAVGEMWKDDQLLDKKEEVVRNMKTDEAVAFGDKLWKEMKEELIGMDQSGKAREVLA